MNPLITSILSIISNIFGNITEAQKDKIALELQANQNITDLLKAQAEINANEAQNSNLFISGWRPFIGWVCGLSFAWQYLLLPISCFIAITIGHPEIANQLHSLHLDSSVMNTVLMGMLGLGGFRSFEKYNDIQNKH